MLYKKGDISLFYIQHLFMLHIPLPLKPSPIIINKINITKDDIKMLSATNTIDINNCNGSITWLDKHYKGKFEELKHLAKNDNLFLFNDTFMFWTLHNKAFEVFRIWVIGKQC